ncbi:MAG: glycosyltransferase family 39 protein [Dongiaceae bacterium]
MRVPARLAPTLALLLLALALFLPGQGSLPPFDRDESRYAQATAQMLESGNWLDIRFQDEPRWRYPAGIYWLQAAAVSLTGEAGARAIWSFRLPSLLGAIAAVLLTLAIGERLLGAAAGRVAAALLAASLLLGTEARLAKTDAMLLATVLLAQLALATIYLGRDAQRPPGRWWAALFWGALGAAAMIKGPIVLLVSGGTVLLLGLSERRWRWLALLRPAWGVPLMLLVLLPWVIAIELISHGQFFAEALGRNMLAKMAEGQQSHGAPPGYYLMLFPVTFWPGSLLAVLAVPFAWRERRSPAVRFCLAWILPTWLVFELVATKLPHYVLPTYPAIACLAAGGLLGGWPRLWRPWAYWTAAGIWTAIGLALAALPLAARLYLGGGIDPWLALSLAVAAPLVAAAPLLLRRDRGGLALAAALAAAWVIYAAAASRGLPRWSRSGSARASPPRSRATGPARIRGSPAFPSGSRAWCSWLAPEPGSSIPGRPPPTSPPTRAARSPWWGPTSSRSSWRGSPRSASRRARSTGSTGSTIPRGAACRSRSMPDRRRADRPDEDP